MLTRQQVALQTHPAAPADYLCTHRTDLVKINDQEDLTLP